MPLFKPGEPALLVPHRDYFDGLKKYQGQTVKILKYEGDFEFSVVGPFYLVQASDGERFYASERVLQKPDSPAREWWDKKINESPLVVSPEQIEKIVREAFVVEI